MCVVWQEREKLIQLNYVMDSTSEVAPSDLRLSRDLCRLNANEPKVLLTFIYFPFLVIGLNAAPWTHIRLNDNGTLLSYVDIYLLTYLFTCIKTYTKRSLYRA